MAQNNNQPGNTIKSKSSGSGPSHHKKVIIKGKEPPPPKPHKKVVIKGKQPPPPKPHKKVVIKGKEPPTPPPKPHKKVVINGKEPPSPKPKQNKKVVINGKEPRLSPTHPRRHHRLPKTKARHSNPVLKFVPLVVIVGIVAILAAVVSKIAIKPATHHTSEYTDNSSLELSPAEKAMQALSEARSLEDEKTNDLATVMAAFQAVTNNYPDTPSARTAARVIRRYQRQIDAEVKECQDKLKQELVTLLKDKKYTDALTLVEDYDGPYKTETADFRTSTAAKIKALQKRDRELARHGLIDQAITKLISGGIPDAYLFVRKNENKSMKATGGAAWQQLKSVLASALHVDNAILQSLKNDIDKTVEIQLKDGRRKLHITDIKDNRIYYQVTQGYARITKSIPLDDLANSERVRRAGDNVNGIAISMALKALRDHQYTTANEYTTALPDPLRGYLQKAFEEERKSQFARNMSYELYMALRLAGVADAKKADLKANLQLLKQHKFSPSIRLLLYGTAKDVWRQSRKTEWIKTVDASAILKYMLAMKPSDEELNPEDQISSDQTADNASTKEDTEAGAAPSETTAGNPENTPKPAIDTDWSKDIDF